MTTYAKGRAFEYQIMGILTRMGYYVARSAGSHGIFDIFGVHKFSKQIIIVQCKRNKVNKRTTSLKEELINLLALKANYIKVCYAYSNIIKLGKTGRPQRTPVILDLQTDKDLITGKTMGMVEWLLSVGK